MADDDKDVANKGAAPVVDLDAIGKMFDQRLQPMANEIAQLKQATAPQQQTQDAPLDDPIAAMVKPHIDRANLLAEAAADQAAFYTTGSQSDLADKQEARGEIEKTFGALMQANRPMTREAIWEAYKGRNIDKFIQKAQNRAKSEADRLAAASTMVDGAGGGRPDPNAPKGNPHEWDEDTLNKAVANISF